MSSHSDWTTLTCGKIYLTCSLEEKRRLLLWKAMTNLESIFKSSCITLQTKVHLVKAMVFPVVMYGCESWTIKKAEHWSIDAFELWCWRRLLRVPWTARRSNQSILKKSVLNICWKDRCWSWNSNILATWWEELTHWIKPWCWGNWGEEKGATENEVVGWHHQLNGHTFKQTLGDREGQGNTACCSSWSQRVGCDWATQQQQQNIPLILFYFFKVNNLFINLSKH